MECPKCGHHQENTVECSACGIYFEKYRAMQERLKAAEGESKAAPSSRKRKGTSPLVPLALILALFTGVLWLFFGAGNTPTPKTITAQPAPLVAEPTGIAAQLAASHPPGNPIEQARNATVFIETPWGTQGSGFIVNSQCDVVTNRHVVDFNSDQMKAAIYNDEELQRNAMNSMNQLREELDYLTRVKRNMLYRGAKKREIEKVDQRMTELRNKLNSFGTDLKDAVDEEVDTMAWHAQSAMLTISLIDGTTFEVNNIERSETFDLATFRLPAENCPFIRSATSTNLHQGDRLYTIGSPAGLTYTVTSGIFSGVRDMEDYAVLQTDAPINPGNSGGPLIREDGSVIGVNTAILLGAAGIGFAIPVEIVKQEFDL